MLSRNDAFRVRKEREIERERGNKRESEGMREREREKGISDRSKYTIIDNQFPTRFTVVSHLFTVALYTYIYTVHKITYTLTRSTLFLLTLYTTKL